MANKESLFLTAAKKVYQHYRPAMWRTLYRTMHKMDYDQRMSQWQATWTISLMGALMMQYGRRTKKLAREIRRDLFRALITNCDRITPETYHLATTSQRYHLILQITRQLHEEMSAKYPDVAPTVQKVTFRRSETRDGKKRTRADATYYDRHNHICYYTHILTYPFDEVIDTIAHEYTHALQKARHSAMPQFILDFLDTHHHSHFRAPYALRPDEVEAARIGALIRYNVNGNFAKFCEKYGRD